MSILSEVLTSAVSSLNAAGVTYIEQFDAQGAKVADQQAARDAAHGAAYSEKIAEIETTKAARVSEIQEERGQRLDAIAAVLGNPGDGAEMETVLGLYAKIQAAAGSFSTLVSNEKEAQLQAISDLSDEYGTFGSVDLS